MQPSQVSANHRTLPRLEQANGPLRRRPPGEVFRALAPQSPSKLDLPRRARHVARPMPASQTIGIDFGTTNTVVSLTGADGQAQLVRFAADGAHASTFRSALSFHADPDELSGRKVEAGPWAIEAYLDDPSETRLIQSFKSYAASPLFTETTIIGRRYRFEDMLSAFLLRLRAHAGAQMADAPPRVIVGRPVRFAGASPDPALALSRYEIAFRRLGFTEVLYAYEPVAAAFFFARRLTEDATVLVADFGGGTSDFSIIRFERRDGALRSDAAGPVRRGGGGRRLRLSDHRQPGFAGAGQGGQLSRLRQHPADPGPLFRDLRPLGPAGPDARLARHARYPRPCPPHPGAGEAGAAGGASGRQSRLPALPVGLEAEGGAVGARQGSVRVPGRRRRHRERRRTDRVRRLDRPRAACDRGRCRRSDGPTRALCPARSTGCS